MTPADDATLVEAPLPHLAAYIEQLGIPETLEQAAAERDAWVESAAMFSRNEDYYRGLLDQIAAHIGLEAWKADDGRVVDDEPVRARLPDLVGAAIAAIRQADGWRDIAEAPRDGMRVLAWWPAPSFTVAGRVGIAKWDKPDGCCSHWTDDGKWCPGPHPTHFRPLPAPPQQMGEG